MFDILNNNFSLLNPYLLLFLIPIIFIIIVLYLNGGIKRSFGALDDIKIIYNKDSFYYKLYFIVLIIIIILYFLIFSRPVLLEKSEKITKNGIDIQIVLDVSYSMVAEDLKPNRLEVAKSVIKSFLDKITSDRVGIIVFSGKTFTSVPLSFDYEVIKNIVSKIDINIINQSNQNMGGTALGDALLLAGESFDNLEDDREKIIILITDGEANKGLNPEASLEYIKNIDGRKIKVYTVGIGGKEGTTIIISDNFGRKQILKVSGVDEKILKKIASETGGKYFRAMDNESLQSIFDTIGSLEKTEIEVESIVVNKNIYIYYVYMLIFVFVLFLSLKFKKRIY